MKVLWKNSTGSKDAYSRIKPPPSNLIKFKQVMLFPRSYYEPKSKKLCH